MHPKRRSRGSIDDLPSGAYRVPVYAGAEPLTGKRHDLVEVVPAGPKAAAEAEKVRTRLLNQVDERRNPRTRATVSQLMDRYLDVDETTRPGYVSLIENHIRRALGDLAVARVDGEVLDSFYAQLRRCRARCNGRPGKSTIESGPSTSARTSAGRTSADPWHSRASARFTGSCPGH